MVNFSAFLNSTSEIEAIAEDHFGNQMIRRVRYAHTEAEIHFPFRRKVQVDGRKNLVLLLTRGKKIRCGTDGAVVLETTSDFFREVVAEFEIRRKRDSLMDRVPVKRAIKCGIEGEIPAANLLVDDRAHLPGPRVGRKLPALVADLVGKTETHGPIPFFGDADARPNVVAYPIPALSILCGSKNVETGLEPVGEAMRDLNGFMPLVIGGEQTVFHRLRALKREIAVQLDHGVARLDRLVAVDLDLVIVLCPRGTGQTCAQQHKKTANGGDAHVHSP